MFEILRKMILPVIIIVLVFFLGMIVLQWGLDITGSKQFAQTNMAGVVNGEEITWNDFQRVYSNLYSSESQNTEDEIPDSRLRELEQMAWDQIVADRLLLQEAAKQNVAVTDDDIYLYLRISPPAFIQQAPAFQTDGQFDYQKYLEAMADPQAAPMWASIEPMLREDLKKIKVQHLVVEGVHVTEAEIKRRFLEAEETVKVGTINVKKSLFGSSLPEMTEEDQLAYFENHREDYTVEERVVLNIVKADKVPSEYDEETARATAQELADSARAGADFAELATGWSQDPGSASKGGDLGWFAPGQMVKEFDSAAFAMSDGEISPPIRTQFGWHVIKHLGYREDIQTRADRKKDTVKSARVSHILIKPVASSETLDLAWDRMDEFRLLAEEKGFTPAAEELGIETHTTEPLKRKSIVSYIDNRPASHVTDWALESEVYVPSGIMETELCYSVVQVAEKLPAGLAEFEDVRSRVARGLREEWQIRMSHDTTAVIREEIRKGKSPKDAADKFGMTYKVLDPFSRTSRVPSLLGDPHAIGAAFALAGVGDISEPVDYSGGSVILELLGRESPDLSQFNEKHDSVFTAVLNAKKQQTFTSWYNYLLESSEIQSNVGVPRYQQ